MKIPFGAWQTGQTYLNRNNNNNHEMWMDGVCDKDAKMPHKKFISQNENIKRKNNHNKRAVDGRMKIK